MDKAREEGYWIVMEPPQDPDDQAVSPSRQATNNISKVEWGNKVLVVKRPNVRFTSSGHVETVRRIRAGEELLVDYGGMYW